MPSAGCGFRKETVAGTRRKERDAARSDLFGQSVLRMKSRLLQHPDFPEMMGLMRRLLRLPPCETQDVEITRERRGTEPRSAGIVVAVPIHIRKSHLSAPAPLPANRRSWRGYPQHGQ